MPRNVRNWWIEIEVDGRKHRVATGPRNKGGGFSIVIKQRDGGSIVKAAEINGFVTDSPDENDTKTKILRTDFHICGETEEKVFATKR